MFSINFVYTILPKAHRSMVKLTIISYLYIFYIELSFLFPQFALDFLSFEGMLTMYLSGIIAFHRPQYRNPKNLHKQLSLVTLIAFLSAFGLSFYSNWSIKNLPEYLKYVFASCLPLHLTKYFYQ